MSEESQVKMTATPAPQVEINLELKSGDRDPSNRLVRFIYSKDADHIIYETVEGQIVVQGNVSLVNHPEVNDLLSEIGDLVTNTPSLKRKYNSMRAHAMKVFLQGDAKGSIGLFTSVIEDMTRYLTRRAKVAYEAGAAAWMLLSLVCVPIARSLGGFDTIGTRVCYAIIFSAMGGLLSITMGAGKLKVDLQDSLIVNAIYGALRILLAMICGVVVVFLVEAKILFAFLKETSNAVGFIVASFVAGFSETLIPNVLYGLARRGEKGGRSE